MVQKTNVEAMQSLVDRTTNRLSIRMPRRFLGKSSASTEGSHDDDGGGDDDVDDGCARKVIMMGWIHPRCSFQYYLICHNLPVMQGLEMWEKAVKECNQILLYSAVQHALTFDDCCDPEIQH